MEFEDPYEHFDPDIMYTLENIPSYEIEDKFNEQFLNGCKCTEQCSLETKCECVLKSGAHYIMPSSETEESILSAYRIKLLDVNKPTYECNSNCNCCSKLCGNRLVQFGPRKHLKIISCELSQPNDESTSSKQIKLHEGTEESTKGLGLITTESIKKGNFICEYAGEVISKREAMIRHKLNEKKQCMNYIFCINEYFGGKNVDTYIDPSKFGNIGRYINHSCQSNCELIPIRVDNTIPKLCIFAAEDINNNCELTFDYGCDNLKSTDAHHSDQIRIKCLCKAEKCRKYLPFSNYDYK